ncbi:flagellar type III secretion system pore protein FliP [Phycicoccus sp. 3266]|uniref:flagellar type III secretion system pore protein FliP n=1 Tax=Phycicoccus sp. 3266 TaxID=2817751 RepID=UPI0028657321|nr:flagellar type III secretion system pore protein FliP [Phycicoccus sp. 3266]MDR6862944.1 flagellar biosynthetic protein FliP [Phycicoccus sp. 3266]
MADGSKLVRRGLAVAALALGGVLACATAASAAPAPTTAVAVTLPALPSTTAFRPVSAVAAPTPPTPSPSPSGTVSVKVDPNLGKPSQAVNVILLLTVLSVAPALLVLCTSFTKIIVVLSLTRNALGTTTIPPNQVLAGLALFLSLFIMSPVLSAINDAGVQPYLKGELTQSQAYDAGVKPLHDFMMKQTRPAELATMVKLSKEEAPATPADVPMTTLVPAFVLSELKSAFIIGFVVFVPFLVIDVVVSSALMSMGMMMLPPALISLPFKLLLFVMVSGWSMIATALVQSYH